MSVDKQSRDEFLHGLFTTALEGGIGYWSQCEKYHWHKPVGEGVNPLDHQDLKGFFADIVEVGDGDDAVKHHIDRAVISKGIKLLASGKCTFGGREMSVKLKQFFAGLDRHYADYPDYDSSDADIVVQAGLFGDVRYG